MKDCSELVLLVDGSLASADGDVFMSADVASHQGNLLITGLWSDKRIAVVANLRHAKGIAMAASSISIGGYGSVVIRPTDEDCTHEDMMDWLSDV